MTEKSQTEKVSTDNGTEPSETDGGAGTEPTGTEPPETGSGAGTGSEPTEEDGRLKALRKKLDEKDAELGKFKKAEEERQRAEMSEVERLRADVEAKEAELTELRISQLRSSIGLKFNLPVELAERLRGSTEEELEADAEKLSEAVPAQRTPPPSASSAGIGGKAETAPSDPLELHRRAVGARQQF